MLPSRLFISFGTISALCWILYGAIIRDLNLILPNVIGTAAGGFQLYLATFLRKDEALFEFTV